jgi:hypothetical protein
MWHIIFSSYPHSTSAEVNLSLKYMLPKLIRKKIFDARQRFDTG